MKNSKSPFYVIEEFVSPIACEEFIDSLDVTVPDSDINGFNIPSIRRNEQSEQILFMQLQRAMPQITSYYGVKYKATERMQFEWIPTGSRMEPQCGNSEFVKGKWYRTRARDFSGILFLTDYQDQPPFDGDYEVYGGKLEFIQHRFSFNPQRGTLVVFPSGPHFLNATSSVEYGDAFQVRLHFVCEQPYHYDPQQFPGNYTTWFRDQITT